jgi:hypothetical protein
MTYHYYGVKGDFAWKLAVDNKLRSTNINHVPRLMRESDQVWCQGLHRHQGQGYCYNAQVKRSPSFQ